MGLVVFEKTVEMNFTQMTRFIGCFSVCLCWCLHFEFVTAVKPLGMKPPESPSLETVWQAQSEIDVETMIWDLPISVLNKPLYASGVSLLQTDPKSII